MYGVLRYLPKNYLSAVTGALAAIPVPRVLRPLVIGCFARLAGADVSVAEKPIVEYGSVADFFVRDLRPGVRPIAPDARLCSPVDGKLLHAEPVVNGRLPQVKDRSYSLEAFLGSAADAAAFSSGSCWHFYLSPPDYHHVHAPFDGMLRRIRHIPGFLWPVNRWALENIPDLFSQNERVVLLFDSPFGRAAVVLIGATNVGKITLTMSDLSTNNLGRRTPCEEDLGAGKLVKRGERVGTFHLGSSVVVLLERPESFVPRSLPATVRYGERLIP